MTASTELTSSPALVQLYLTTVTQLAALGLSAAPPGQPAAAEGACATDALDGNPLTEGRYISSLLAACGDDLLPFVQLYHGLLGAAAAGGGRLHLVSALAFGCPQLLPRLWRCDHAQATTIYSTEARATSSSREAHSVA